MVDFTQSFYVVSQAMEQTERKVKQKETIIKEMKEE
jgi:hypothetical protein